MLRNITPKQVHRIAELAKTARNVRDTLLHGAPGQIAAEPHPAKGEIDQSGAGAFDVLPAGDPAATALREEIAGLKAPARSELFALMRIGQSELAAGDWERLLAEAETLGDQCIGGILADDIDLQSHLDKGLYEMKSV